MTRRISLPLTRDGGTSVGSPSVDIVRRKLGGRASSDPGAGDLVAISATGVDERLGVVLFAKGDEVAVWVAEGIVRRTARAQTKSVRSATPPELSTVANDARVFGSLAEGQRVRYEPDPGHFAEGTLIEK